MHQKFNIILYICKKNHTMSMKKIICVSLSLFVLGTASFAQDHEAKVKHEKAVEHHEMKKAEEHHEMAHHPVHHAPVVHHPVVHHPMHHASARAVEHHEMKKEEMHK